MGKEEKCKCNILRVEKARILIKNIFIIPKTFLKLYKENRSINKSLKDSVLFYKCLIKTLNEFSCK